MESLYLDHAATTPLAPEVRVAMAPWLEEGFGNPSSRHGAGVEAARALDRAREAVAAALGADPAGVVFTSGGTEANNLGVLGLARARIRGSDGAGAHVLLGATEHACVHECGRALAAEGFEVERLAVDEGGGLDLARAAEQVRAETVLVSQMLVNNEFGTLYPVRRLARAVRARAPRAWIHVDAVQALGKLPVGLGLLDVDALSISAHKAGGPKGVGALVLRRGVEPRPLLLGGGQERGLRSGTQNVAGIVGLGAAAERAADRRSAAHERAARLRATFLEALSGSAGVSALEPGTEHSPFVLALTLAGPPAEVLQHHLEEHGLLVGVGSACQSNKKEVSPALLALGLDVEAARRVLRISFSGDEDPERVAAAARTLSRVQAELEELAR